MTLSYDSSLYLMVNEEERTMSTYTAFMQVSLRISSQQEKRCLWNYADQARLEKY